MTEPRKSRDRYVEDPELGLITELEPIEISGTPRGDEMGARTAIPQNVIELEPFDIVGDPNADVAPFPAAGRRDDGVSTMLPDWVPSWATQAVGQPVEGQGGATEWEVPEWAAELVADSDGQMPESVLGAGAQLSANLIPGYALGRQFLGDTPSPEARTVSPMAATLGAADTGAVVLNGLSRLVPGDHTNFVGLLDDDRGAAWDREVQTTRRQNPGSFALGEGVGMAAQMALPGASQGRGASAAARAGYAALEGAAYGALEGLGRSDADTLAGRGEDALLGALGGGVVSGGLGAAAGRQARRAAEPVDQRAVDQALDSAAWERLSQAGAQQSLSSARQRILAPGTTERARTQSARRTVGRLRDEGVFAPGMLGLPAGPETIQARIAERMPVASATIGGTLERMQDVPVDVTPLLSHVQRRVAELDRIPGAEQQANAMRTNLARFQQRADAGDMTMAELQTWKTFWRQNTNFEAPLQADRQGIYGAISDTMQQGVDSVDPVMGAQYRDARDMYRIGSAFEEAGGDLARNEARQRRVSLTDTLSGLEGFRNGGILGGVAGIVMNKGLRRNEHALRAASLERTARRLQEAPERFGRWAQRLQAAQARGGHAFSAALFVAAQDDEAVRAAMAEREEDEATREEGAREAEQRSELDSLFQDTAPVTPPTEAELDALFQ